MAVIISGIVTGLTEDPSAAIVKARKRLGIQESDVKESCIVKTSLDARKQSDIHFVHSVALTLYADEAKVSARAADKQVALREEQPLEVTVGNRPLPHRPVIAGFGPAGMFAGLLLARYGYRPLILERGDEISRRVQAVETFWATGKLDPDTNVQFGEGGAGTFSDGKLTTRIGDPKCSWVVREFVRFGAPPEILQKAKPHIGTDRLREVVGRIRSEILSLGGEIRFRTPLTGLRVRNGSVTAALTPEGEIPTGIVILATGHSARDTFRMLYENGFAMEPKPFSVGVRVEHLQSEIDRGLYGKLAGHPVLPVGEYQLSHRRNGRGVYTFCMCPGGVVVPAASETGMAVTNGMSYFARDGKNANAAVAVAVTPGDYGRGALDGVCFQQELERRAFQAAGGGYRAPAQDAAHFLNSKPGLTIGRVQPTYARGVEPCDFSDLFPGFVTEMLRLGLQNFNAKLPGFAAPDTLLTGVETRTSSPVRILRGEDCQSLSAKGLYPCAEGAGYAGGIMSAAVDGLRVSQAVIAQAAPATGE
ncbi:NAD(P)/FAD-dependent oxidoreductase [Anaerotruncus rubiinfantis]|uniref:NAD(P)/FAD-dependent oxidoreductase n=1 Tax=Anaerotruncus rubiinfantis TaxID=1720200 RepID=UPI0011CC47F9|nr:hypothetical protein [Anaerotruncus rubiinfantis]